MWQPRVGISWDPGADGQTVVRLNAGLFYGARPGPDPRHRRAPRTAAAAQNAFRASFFNGFGVTPPTYPNLLPAEAGEGTPDHPGVFVFDEDFQNPRTWSASAVDRARGRDGAGAARPVQLRQGRAHHALPRAERHRLRLPVGHRHRRRRHERHRLRHVRRRRPHERRVDGQEQLQRPHLRPDQALVATTTSSRRTTRCRGTSRTTTTSATRSPTATSATTTSTPSTATRTATSATA